MQLPQVSGEQSDMKEADVIGVEHRSRRRQGRVASDGLHNFLIKQKKSNREGVGCEA